MSGNRGSIELTGLTKRFGAGDHPAVHDVSADLAQGTAGQLAGHLLRRRYRASAYL
jgi:hypothetical protein